MQEQQVTQTTSAIAESAEAGALRGRYGDAYRLGCPWSLVCGHLFVVVRGPWP
jgi:hypothetical protein